MEAITVTAALPLTPPNVAVIVADPCFFAVTDPVPETTTAAVFDEFHAAELVISLLVLSLYKAVAVNCSL